MARVKAAESLASVVTLSNGVVMPMFGFGTFKTCESDIVASAIKQGYRLIDTAQYYGNEEEVGLGIKKSGVPREDVFVVSKVHWNSHGFDECTKSLEESLKKLDVGYVDLYLIHSPEGGKILGTYDALLKFQERGLIRAVGVSNFGIHQIKSLAQNGRPLPAVNQIELNVHLQQQEIADYCMKNHITVMGWSPLGKWRQDSASQLQSMADRYGKSVAQLMIRWSVQKGYITIPKTSTPARLAENANVFDFTISEEDMLTLKGLPQKSCIQDWDPTAMDFMP